MLISILFSCTAFAQPARMTVDDMNREAMDERILERIDPPHRKPPVSYGFNTMALRELSLDSMANEALLNITDANGAKHTIIDVLFNHVLNGDIKAHIVIFDTSYMPTERILRYKNILDTGTVFSVNKLLVAESWVYNDKQKQMHVNIVAVALSYSLNDSTDKPLFWVNYHDLIHLRGYTLPTVSIEDKGKQQHAALFVEYFERRLFQSKLIRGLE